MAAGVIKKLNPEDRSYYTINDVSAALGCSRAKACTMIKYVREQYIASGKMTPVYPAGKIPKKFFNECTGM